MDSATRIQPLASRGNIGQYKVINERFSVSSKDFLSRKEAVAYLNSLGYPISISSLEKMASNNNAGNGPPFMRFRWKTVRYRRDELEAWAKRETVEVQ